MLSISSITQECDSVAGITAIEITDIQNLNADFSQISTARTFTITFRQYSADFREIPQSGAGGEYYRQTLSAFVPRKRASVDLLAKALLNKRFIAIAKDRYGNTYRIIPARYTHSFSTGKRPGEDHGYNISITGIDLKRGYYYIAAAATPTGTEFEPEEGDNPINTGPTTEGGNPQSYDCCVLVNPIQLSYIPGTSANANNRNQIVKASDSTQWFIDKDGRGVQLGVGNINMDTISSTGTSWLLSNIDLAAISNPDKQLLVERNGFVLKHSNTPTETIHYGISGGNIIVSDDWPLESGEYLKIRQIG